MRFTRQIIYWTLGGFDGARPVEDVLRDAREMGYDGVELCFGAGVLAPGVSEERCRGIRACAAGLGLKLETLCTGAYWTCSLTDPRAAVRRRAIAFTREYLRVASWLGAKTVLVIPGHVAVPWDAAQPVVPYAEALRRSAESLRACLPAARRFRVCLALENVWNGFLADPLAMRTFVDRFRSPGVGVYFDVANCLINGYPEHWIEMLGPRIRAVHFKNFSRQDGGGTLHGFTDDLLKGDVDWPAVLRALRKIRYNGPVTAEMIPPGVALPARELARATAAQMRNILASCKHP